MGLPALKFMNIRDHIKHRIFTRLKCAVVVCLGFFFLRATLIANTFTVTNSNDSGSGSLAQAITDANNAPGADTIVFDILGVGVHVIDVSANGLPGVTDDVTIDGYTQPGAQQNTLAVGDNAIILIQIDGGGPTSTIETGLLFAVRGSLDEPVGSLVGGARPRQQQRPAQLEGPARLAPVHLDLDLEQA